MFKAVIFDMDGLLIDSEPFWRRSHIEVLANHGYKITEEDARAGAGKRTPDQVLVWHEMFKWQDLSNEDLVNEITDNVTNLIRLNGKALPGVHKVIKMFQIHKIPMAVASSSAEKIIEAVLDYLGIKSNFVFSYSAENEKRGKPFPDVFLTTANKLKVKPAECLVFEDSINGVKAAKAAGMKCIAVPEFPYNAEEFKAADIVMSTLENVDWPMIEKLWNASKH
jgi:HAD superfamily hydrolase (TIGR01509 family)